MAVAETNRQVPALAREKQRWLVSYLAGISARRLATIMGSRPETRVIVPWEGGQSGFMVTIEELRGILETGENKK